MSLEEIKNNLESALTKQSKGALTILKIQSEKSVKRNFEVGGRPEPWPPSKKSKKHRGTKTLVISGNMSNITAEEDLSGLRIILMTNPLARAYSRIHQEGGTINHPGGKRKLKKLRPGDKTRRSVFASSDAKRFVKEVDIKPYKINIPARPYMVIPPEDHDLILRLMATFIKV